MRLPVPLPARLSVRVLTATAASLALVGGAAGYAAASPTTDDAVQACVDKQGRLRVQTGEACAPGESPLTWSVQGPQGPAGLQGVQGVPGPQGVQGAPGLSAVKNVWTSPRSVPARSSVSLVVSCPDDKLALSASPVLQGGLVQDRLEPTEPARGYQLDVTNPTGVALSARVTLVCATVTPGALLPGHDEVDTRQVGSARPLPGVWATPTASPTATPTDAPVATPTAAPTATQAPASPPPALPQSPWESEGELAWTAGVSADGRTFDVRVSATGFAPDADVAVTGSITYRHQPTGTFEHTTWSTGHGEVGSGFRGYCATTTGLRFTFTQGDLVRTGTAATPC